MRLFEPLSISKRKVVKKKLILEDHRIIESTTEGKMRSKVMLTFSNEERGK